MKHLCLILAFLGLPAAAQAAPQGLADDFTAICGTNRMDMSRAVDTARARGWTQVAVKMPANLTAMTVLSRKVDGAEWAVVVSRGLKPASGRTPAQAYQTCNVTGIAGPDDAASVRRWAGMPAHAGASYFFKEEGGRRTALGAADNDQMLLELRGNGYFLLQIDQRSGFTSLQLTRSNAAP